MPESATLTPPARGSSGRRPVKALVLYAVDHTRRTMSYQHGWPKAFARDARFDATLANVKSRAGRLFTRAALAARTFDAIVVLHSVLSNEGVIDGSLVDAIGAHPATKAYFIGNEYKLMVPKMEFAERIGVSLLVSMTTNPKVHGLYRERLGCEVASIPSAGLDTDVFHPTTNLPDRPIDLGMRAYPEPWYLGHRDRKMIALYFTDHAEELGLTVDLSFDEQDRFTPSEYASFLNRCRGQLGTEAGSVCFDFYDELNERVTKMMHALPGSEIWNDPPAFYAANGPDLPARTISGRHTEAAGTKTVQILFRGEYSGFFEPDVHYLCLEKDFSNVDDVIARFRDDDVCLDVAENAYRVAVEELTYERLLDRFLAALKPLLPARPVR